MTVLRKFEPMSDVRGFEERLESTILSLGTRIFDRIKREAPGPLSSSYYRNLIMEWSMRDPEFKTNLFRLVDVLPVLESDKSVAEHVDLYLRESASKINRFFGWLIPTRPNLLYAKFVSQIVKRSVREMAGQFIAGEDPDRALPLLRGLRRERLAFTVDLLGEFCVSEKEARDYLARYLDTLNVLEREILTWRDEERRPIVPKHPCDATPACISIKLSALYSQCSPLNFDRSVEVLTERLGIIAKAALKVPASIYVDAEDSGNNPIIYETFKSVFGSSPLKSIPYPGIVVQAYARGAMELTRGLVDFAIRRGSPIAIRLVKGAYWDSETVSAAQNGKLSPLFRTKESSDANFELISRYLLDNREHVFPAFGSHNVRSLTHAIAYADAIGATQSEFELQMLYGMATDIGKAYRDDGYLVRMYVPIGEMISGMGYLVRRLLENTSNESFLRLSSRKGTDPMYLLSRPEFRD